MTLPKSLAVADMDNDDENEIIVGSAYPSKFYYAFNGDGTRVAGFSLETTETTSDATPLITDLTYDGNLEIVGADYCSNTKIGHFYVWTLQSPFHATLKGWHKFRYDQQNSGMVK